ncbi:hypothetical protein [Brevibacillus laterosporus]|uniref:Lipoprotein n=1 Tax=Brevibacillus laterosporus TaxID=1465 RepID=A0AAP3GBF0_BRELA|nr:hypothetical protein [Brevibacillus laterosporus]MCR8980807.1 hypothetical protein [Brevibacillus laterosporus]MCZ0807962.1 hypothetical protein [Brevibacillus laterosporus]MCZ0826147.1 hypothetical protein [Brevibacillus laterosporus]MCZ0852290.1 hypothetical protein [Brevibacillus laterosporus]
MKKRTMLLAVIASLLLVTGCSGNQSDTAPTEQAQDIKVNQIDLTAELKLTEQAVIGKTTLAQMEKTYGSAVEKKTIKSNFRTNLKSENGPNPEVEQEVAFIKINPVTGAKWNKAYPLYFTKTAEPALVAAQVMLKRGDLMKKLETEKQLTLEDVKKVYGAPTRDLGRVLEYYDFNNKAVLHVILTDNNQISTMLTHYGLLYADKPEDMIENENIIKRLSQEKGSASK